MALAERPGRARLAARLPTQREGSSADDQGGGPADPRLRAADHLRRRRHPEVAGRRGAARAGRADRHLRRHHADGSRRLPRQPPAVPRHAGHARQRHGGHGDAAQRSADHARRPLRRSHHRQGRCVRPRGQDHPRRHRPGRAGQGPATRRPDRRRCEVRHRGDHLRDQVDARRRFGPGRHVGVEEQGVGLAGTVPDDLRAVRAGRRAQAAVLHRGAEPARRAAHDRRVGRRPAPDVHVAVLRVQRALHLGQLRWPRHDGLLDPGGDRGQGREARVRRVGGRRRRLLPDDRAGARDRDGRRLPDQGGAAQQQLPRHGPSVAGDVLRRALLRGVPERQGARLRDVGRVDGLRRHPASSHPRRSARRSRRRTRSRTAPSSSSSAPTPPRRCSRWFPPVTATTI